MNNKINSIRCVRRLKIRGFKKEMVEGEGFEPSKAEPSDLQSDPFGRSGTPPRALRF